ncbi:MAG: hypothetical protein M3R65_07225 [Gemmatimonadota bacterium]|nr:hypothetical protein [Gemmatimonadota bacterium]
MEAHKHCYFVTSAAHAALTSDDALVVDALRTSGIQVRPLVWTESLDELAPLSLLVLRSVWDYHLNAPAFLDWITAVEQAGHRLLNRPELIRWNIDKRYLVDLAAAGVATIPTVWLGRGEARVLADEVDSFNSDAIVLKPTVSASAFETHLLHVLTNRAHADRVFADLHQRFDLIVQPYLPEIASAGEWSLMFFDGDYSHSVRKKPAPGDFRVQVDFGGAVHPETAPLHVRESAARVVRCLPGPTPLYTRTDGIAVDGRFLLMEAECIDPVLFFRFSEASVIQFADRVRTAVHQDGCNH